MRDMGEGATIVHGLLPLARKRKGCHRNRALLAVRGVREGFAAAGAVAVGAVGLAGTHPRACANR
jgi:hypothetical protein